MNNLQETESEARNLPKISEGKIAKFGMIIRVTDMYVKTKKKLLKPISVLVVKKLYTWIPTNTNSCTNYAHSSPH